MVAYDGPVPVDLGNVGTQDAMMTQSDSDTSNDMSCEDVCAIAHKARMGTGKKGPNGPVLWHRGKGADEWTSDGSKKGGKKGSNDSKPHWYGDKDKGGTGNKSEGKGKGKGKSEAWYCYDCGGQGHTE